MKRFVNIVFVILSILLLLGPQQAQASTFLRSPGEEVYNYQSWRMGFSIRPALSYTELRGTPIELAARMSSSRDSDIYFVFPIVSTGPDVNQASFNILERSGTYSGTASMSLGVYASDGTLQRLISTSSIDLQSAPTQAWSAITLDSDTANLRIAPGEALAFHLTLDGATGDDLLVSIIFDVVTRTADGFIYRYYFPIIVK